jgi:hypothetical protein
MLQQLDRSAVGKHLKNARLTEQDRAAPTVQVATKSHGALKVTKNFLRNKKFLRGTLISF